MKTFKNVFIQKSILFQVTKVTRQPLLISRKTFTCTGESIDNLLQYYRYTWPGETVTPKMHLLEDHAVDFMERWGSSFGIYGEQGAESMHASFNAMKVNYRSMHKPVERLKAMLKEHYLRVHPKSISIKPVPKKRKLLRNRTTKS